MGSRWIKLYISILRSPVRYPFAGYKIEDVRLNQERWRSVARVSLPPEMDVYLSGRRRLVRRSRRMIHRRTSSRRIICRIEGKRRTERERETGRRERILKKPLRSQPRSKNTTPDYFAIIKLRPNFKSCVSEATVSRRAARRYRRTVKPGASLRTYFAEGLTLGSDKVNACGNSAPSTSRLSFCCFL